MYSSRGMFFHWLSVHSKFFISIAWEAPCTPSDCANDAGSGSCVLLVIVKKYLSFTFIFLVLVCHYPYAFFSSEIFVLPFTVTSTASADAAHTNTFALLS